MRVEKQVLRYTRFAAVAWLVFIFSLGISRFGDEFLGASGDFLSLMNLCMQASFAAGCVLASTTVGVLALARSVNQHR